MTPTRIVTAVVVTALSGTIGCSDVAVPPGVLITCDADDACPAPLICEPTTRLCVAERAPPVTVEGTVAPGLLGQPDVDVGTLITAALTTSSPPLQLPAVSLTLDGVAVASMDVVAGDSDTSFTATLAASTSLPEGRLAVLVDVVDLGGVPARAVVGLVELDITPPTIAGATVQRLPDPRLTPVAFDIADAPAVGPNVGVRLSFAVDEPVRLEGDDAPTLTPELALPFVRDPAFQNPLAFDLVWPDPAPAFEGRIALSARVVDRAGNVTVADLDVDTDPLLAGGLLIDTVPPEPPTVDVDDAVVLERAPWGRAENTALDVYTVRGAAAVEPGAIVLVSREQAQLRELGRVVADDDGSFGGLESLLLATGDVREVFVQAADEAGNLSARVRVRDSIFIASPGGKEIGELIENPHRIESVAFVDGRLDQGGIVEHSADEGLNDVDGDAFTTEGAGTFRQLATGNGAALTSQAGVLVGTAAGHDPVRGVTLFFGGQDTARIERGTGSLNDRDFCTGAVDDLLVLGLDDRVRRLSPDIRPPAMARAAIAFDPTRQGLVIVGENNAGQPQMWLFDGDDDFTRLCDNDACAATMPDGLSNHGLVYDFAHRELLAHGGELGTGTWAFREQGWVQVCGVAGDGCTATEGGVGDLVWDDTSNRVLWFNGATLAAWDGTSWTPICQDDACLASRPPRLNDVAAAWDRARGRLVVFGGQNADSDGLACNEGIEFAITQGAQFPVPLEPPSSSTWEFDGAVWSEMPAAVSPPPRTQHTSFWDERLQAVIITGGDDCDCYDRPSQPGFRSGFDEDAWAWNGVTWRRLDGQPTLPAGFVREGAPSARDHRMTPWPEQGGVLVVGDNVNGDVFHLLRDGRFYRATSGTTSVGDYQPGLATDDEGVVRVFGGAGVGGGGIGPSEAPFPFAVVGTSTTPACLPDPFCGFGQTISAGPYGHAMHHDGVEVVLFGGSTTGRPADLSFVLTDLASQLMFVWRPDTGLLNPCAGGACGTLPDARIGALMTRTNVDGESFLYGGMPHDASPWIFDGGSWREVSTSVVPRRRHDQVMAFETHRGAVVMTGGTDDIRGVDNRGGNIEHELPADLDDVYEFVDDDWHLANVADPEGDGRPLQRYGAASTTDENGFVVMHGGTPSPAVIQGLPTSGTARLSEVWRFDGGATARPAQRFRARSGASGLEPEAIVGAEVRWLLPEGEALGTLEIWDGQHFRALPAVSCGDGCQRVLLDGALARRAVVGVEEEIIVARVGLQNGPAPGYATLHTDYLDVRLHYRLD